MLSKIKININEGELRYDYYRAIGLFFTLDKSSTATQVRTCREEFAHCFERSTNLIGFELDKRIDAARFNKFLTHIERKLKLKQKSTIYQTNRPQTILIRPCRFWLATEDKRNWFTLFVRCGIVYYKKNFQAAYKKYELTRYILPAIPRFLNGYTKLACEMNEYGIIDTLADYGDDCDSFVLREDWKRLLRKP